MVWQYGTVMAKATYSLDDATIRRIRGAALRFGKPQSQIVREAVADYVARANRLSESERLRMLSVLEDLRQAPVTRTREAVQAEIDEIRASRREGWHGDED